MSMRYFFMAVFSFVTMLPCTGITEIFKVSPADSVIVMPTNIPARVAVAKSNQIAADELQKHLQLITGTKISIIKDGNVLAGKYPFYIGIIPGQDTNSVISQESRWLITPQGSWFYGDIEGRGNGVQFAVYSFLEEQLGVSWIEPGDKGIVYHKISPLILTAGYFNWIPELMFRSIRQGSARVVKKMYKLKEDYQDFLEFQSTLKYHNEFAEDVMRWQQRMRMGGARPGGGHTFDTWWGRFGITHPKYFAVNKFGKREPVPAPKPSLTDSFVKICPSNPEVVDQIISDWLPKKNRIKFINACMNDGAENFCECVKCKNLDVPLSGERFADHLTDRYVYLANAVARKVKKHRSDACVTMYAYLNTLYPPRKLRVESNIVVQIVPYVIPLDLKVAEDILGGWKRAGATMLALRPNYHTKYLTGTIPIGVEKQMFDVFQMAVSNGCISADYDSLVNNWPVTGLSDFILASAMSDPSKPFDYWCKKYYSAFGKASSDIENYFTYWRDEVWENRLFPNIVTICNKGGSGDFVRGLYWSLGDYYKLSDFDKTDSFLKDAARKNLISVERIRINELMLANTHARLIFQAITAAPMNKSKFAEALLTFRKSHIKDLPLQWLGVFSMEIGNGDITGLKLSKNMAGYLDPWLKTELFWKFLIDPGDKGLKEKWQKYSWADVAEWDKLRTDRFWEKQFDFDEKKTLSKELSDVIDRYDGIGWYVTQIIVPADWKERRVFIRFGAVDESCQVYLNGVFAGEHLYKERNDWKVPFEIEINDLIDWSKDKQVLTVRVEDKGGMGGIWRPVWIVSKK